MYPGIPALPRGVAWTALALNLLVPGTGTALAAAKGGDRLLATKAALQLLFALVLVGWFWALVTSYKVVVNAREASRRTAPRRVRLRPAA